MRVFSPAEWQAEEARRHQVGMISWANRNGLLAPGQHYSELFNRPPPARPANPQGPPTGAKPTTMYGLPIQGGPYQDPPGPGRAPREFLDYYQNAMGGGPSQAAILNPGQMVNTPQGTMHQAAAQRLGLSGSPLPVFQGNSILNPAQMTQTAQGTMHNAAAQRLGLSGSPLPQSSYGPRQSSPFMVGNQGQLDFYQPHPTGQAQANGSTVGMNSFLGGYGQRR